MGKLTTKYCGNRQEVNKVHKDITAANYLSFLNITEVSSNDVCYSFKVFDLNGNTILFVGYYYSENE
jgi:hypothetical protein